MRKRQLAWASTIEPLTEGLQAPFAQRLYAEAVKVRVTEPWVCPTCGDHLKFEILDDERFLVAWSCVNCGLIRTTEPI